MLHICILVLGVYHYVFVYRCLCIICLCILDSIANLFGCYKRMGSAFWPDGRVLCENVGGYMLSIDSEKENQAIAGITRSYRTIYINPSGDESRIDCHSTVNT